MISNHDRSGWFGASDANYIVSRNTSTKSFANWWLVKLGLTQNDFTNEAMQAGTWYEHEILQSLGLPDMEMDRQILLPELLLRVNLDGNTPDTIYETKTYKWEEGFVVPAKYIHQVNVQMFAWQQEFGFIPRACILAYGLKPEDYKNYFNPIDSSRRQLIPVQYDQSWIENKFLPALEYKRDCLKNGIFP